MYRSFAYPLHGAIRAATVPRLTGVEITSTPQLIWNTYGGGERIDFTARFNGRVDVTGTPDLSILVGVQVKYATYRSGSGTNAIVFSYTVQSGDSDSAGVRVHSGYGMRLNAAWHMAAVEHDWAMSSIRLRGNETIRARGTTTDAILTNNHWDRLGKRYPDHRVNGSPGTGSRLVGNLTKASGTLSSSVANEAGGAAQSFRTGSDRGHAARSPNKARPVSTTNAEVSIYSDSSGATRKQPDRRLTATIVFQGPMSQPPTSTDAGPGAGLRLAANTTLLGGGRQHRRIEVVLPRQRHRRRRGDRMVSGRPLTTGNRPAVRGKRLRSAES